MAVSKAIQEHAIRLGAKRTVAKPTNSIEFLLQGYRWPTTVFGGSVERMRQALIARGEPRAAQRTAGELRDTMGMLYRFRFLETPGSFWDGWPQQFSAVDSAEYFPFATDDYFFYFLSENRKDKLDPLVSKVDHEETNLEPYVWHYPVSCLLAILEPWVESETDDV